MGSQWTKRAILGSLVIFMAGINGCSAPPSSPPKLVTSDLPNLSNMEALLRGTLSADGEGCLQVKGAGDPVTLVWPRGYTSKGDSKSFEVLDASKNVVARSGDPVSLGGGGVDSFEDTWAGHECAKGRLWMVGKIG